MLAIALFLGGAVAAAALESAALPALPAGLVADKAYAVIDGCQGLALQAEANLGAVAQLITLSDSLTQRFVLRQTPGGVQLEAIALPLRLRAVAEGLQFGTQGDDFTVNARGPGQYELGRADGTPFLSTPCAQPWRIEQFPVVSPTRRSVWVDIAAPGGGDGTRAKPYNAIQAAVGKARPGDYIRVAPGIYRETVLFTRATSGTKDAWVVLAASEPLRTLILSSGEGPVIDLRQAHHIEINGLALNNSGTGDCLFGRGGTHHRIIGLYVANCGGGGIGLTGDYEYVEGNVAARNAKRSVWQNSGISIWQAKASPLRKGEKPELRLIVRRNASFLNDNLVLAPGSTIVTDGNGIILDDARNTQAGSKWAPYPHRALVEQNLVFGNGGSGLRVFRSDRVTLRYNTTYANDRSKLARGSGQAEIGTNECFDCYWTGNLAVKPMVQGRQRIVFDYNTRNVRYLDNVFFDPRPDIALAHREGPSAASLDLSRNISDTEPVFARPELDETASFVVLGWKGRVPATLGQIGARPELIPSLKRPDVLKRLGDFGEAPQ